MSLARERNLLALACLRGTRFALGCLRHYARLRLACSLTLRPLSLTLMQTLSRASDRVPAFPVDSFKNSNPGSLNLIAIRPFYPQRIDLWYPHLALLDEAVLGY